MLDVSCFLLHNFLNLVCMLVQDFAQAFIQSDSFDFLSTLCINGNKATESF